MPGRGTTAKRHRANWPDIEIRPLTGTAIRADVDGSKAAAACNCRLYGARSKAEPASKNDDASTARVFERRRVS